MFNRMVVGLVVGLLVGLVAGSAMAATDITNTCTGQYTVTGLSTALSGLDTAVGRLQVSPALVIAKSINNLRLGQSDPNSVNMLSGDTLQFDITWSNDGEASADTVVFSDYVPSGMTFITGTETFTSAQNCTNPAISESGGMITFSCTAAAGTDPGAKAQGAFSFRVNVN